MRKVIICMLMVFVSITTISCGKISRKDKVTHPSEQLKQKSRKSESGNNHFLLWSALIISLFANAGYTYVLYNKTKERTESRLQRLRNNVDKLENDFILEKSQQHARETTRNGSSTRYTLIDGDINLIVDRVLECINIDKTHENTYDDVGKNPPQPKTIKKLYAEAANKDNEFFRKVTEYQSEDTIYVLSLIDDNRAEFVICDSAKSTIIGCEDYLRNVCDIIGSGRNIENCEPGIAQKTSDGSWKVIEKANVKFV
ncbi:MAG: hypothetical protein IJZ06_06245 [Bacteroidales bacterium]|nr:hypothetical protein [Bacteroidales bacterium]